jgi:hypothetical protein
MKSNVKQTVDDYHSSYGRAPVAHIGNTIITVGTQRNAANKKLIVETKKPSRVIVVQRKHARLNVGVDEQNRWISCIEKQQQQQGVSATHSINMLLTDGGVCRLLEMDQWSSSDIPQDDGTIASTAAVVDAECLDLVF